MKILTNRAVFLISVLCASSISNAFTIMHTAEISVPLTGTTVTGNCLSSISGNTGSNPVTEIKVSCVLKRATIVQSAVQTIDYIEEASAAYDIQVNAPIAFSCMWCTHNGNLFYHANGSKAAGQPTTPPKKCKWAEPPNPPPGGDNP